MKAFCPSSARSFTLATANCGINLLRFRPVLALVRWAAFPALLQVVILLIFVGLAILGWGHYTPKGVNAKLYAKTNLVNLTIWGLWWPAIVWVTFLLGRAWCIVCPLELVSTHAEKLGTILGLARRPLATGWPKAALSFFSSLFYKC